jgi:ABC-type uncharacterized transport system permease subunit
VGGSLLGVTVERWSGKRVVSWFVLGRVVLVLVGWEGLGWGLYGLE